MLLFPALEVIALTAVNTTLHFSQLAHTSTTRRVKERDVIQQLKFYLQYVESKTLSGVFSLEVFHIKAT